MIVRVCPQCGKHNPENTFNCSDCGTTLSMNSLMDTEKGKVVKQKEKAPVKKEKEAVKPVALEYTDLRIKDESPTMLVLETKPSGSDSLTGRELLLPFAALILFGLLGFALIGVTNKNVLRTRETLFLVLVFGMVVLITLGLIVAKLQDFSQKFRHSHHVTTITIDAASNMVTRTETHRGSLSNQRELSLNQISKITIFTEDSSPMPPDGWRSVMAFTLLDASNFVINAGRNDEMKFLAEKLSGLIQKPLEQKYVFAREDLPK